MIHQLDFCSLRLNIGCDSLITLTCYNPAPANLLRKVQHVGLPSSPQIIDPTYKIPGSVSGRLGLLCTYPYLLWRLRWFMKNIIHLGWLKLPRCLFMDSVFLYCLQGYAMLLGACFRVYWVCRDWITEWNSFTHWATHSRSCKAR